MFEIERPFYKNSRKIQNHLLRPKCESSSISVKTRNGLAEHSLISKNNVIREHKNRSFALLNITCIWIFGIKNRFKSAHHLGGAQGIK